MKMSKLLYKEFNEALQNTFAILNTDQNDLRAMAIYKAEELTEVRFAFDLFNITPKALKTLLWDSAYGEGLNDDHIRTAVLDIFRTRFDYDNGKLKEVA
jgi:hypothetical protein